MSLRLEPRLETSQMMVWLAPVIAVILTLIVASVLFTLMGKNPLLAMQGFFIDPIMSKRGLTELAVKASPLILIGVGLSFGFRAGIWNIGAEGQLIIGGLAGGSIALLFYESEGLFILPLMLVTGAVAGMAWAALPAWFRTRFQANEILTSLMLSYVAYLLLNLLIHGILRDPNGFSFPQSRLFQDAALVPTFFRSRFHLGIFLVIGLVGVAWLFLSRHWQGFVFQLFGQAPRAAGFSGIENKVMVWRSMLIGGGAAGLAGILEVAGPLGQIVPTLSPGYGFTAIIVAFLGRLHPAGIFLAGLVLALTFLGGEAVQVKLNMPSATTGVFQGLLLFFLLGVDVLVRYRLRWKSSR